MTNRANALRSAFAGAGNARTDALKSITLPTRRPTTATDELAVEVPEEAEPTPADPQPRQQKKAEAAGRERSRGSTGPKPAAPAAEERPTGPRSTIVYVTPAMRDALRQQVAREPHVTFTDLVLDALETHESDLSGLWTSSAARSGRFTRSSSNRHGRRDEPGVQLALRLTASNVAALDDMMAELGAPSRTALVEEALRRYYKPR